MVEPLPLPDDPTLAAAAPALDDSGFVAEATGWLVGYRQFWEQSLDRLDDYLRDLKKAKEKSNVRKQRKS